MRTEEGVQIYWQASLAWKRIPGFVEGVNVQMLFERLEPLYTHRSLPLQRQSDELSKMIVHGKIHRKAKPRKKLHNLVKLPVRTKLETVAA